MTQNKDYRNIHIITTETDAEYETLQEILREGDKRLSMFEAMTKEERIEYFRSRLYPPKTEFRFGFREHGHSREYPLR